MVKAARIPFFALALAGLASVASAQGYSDDRYRDESSVGYDFARVVDVQPVAIVLEPVEGAGRQDGQGHLQGRYHHGK